MSPIAELIKEYESDAGWRERDEEREDLADACVKAMPDLARLVEYLRDKAPHNEVCGYWFEKPCDCGLREIQSLIGE